MKKIILIIMLVLIFSAKDVFAATVATSDQGTEFTTLKSEYESGIKKVTVSSPQSLVTIYGYSKCDGTSCDVSYYGGNTTAEDALSKSIVCANGEKYVYYDSNVASGGLDYKSDNKAQYTGDAYWTEDYFVTCTSNRNESDNTLTPSGSDELNGGNKNDGNENDGNINNGSNDDINNDVTDKNDDYSSADTTDPSKTGVETYYVVLGVIVALTYSIMYLIKKYNLFKKI